MTAQGRITEWAALADKATEGPWFVESDEDEGTRVSYLHQRNGLVLLGSVASEGQELFFEDAAHIASSRTAVPAMAAALTAVLSKLAEVDAWEKFSTRDIGDAFDANSVLDLVQEARAAIETALGVTL